MKIFQSELVQNYDTYTFGYTVYAKRESKDSLVDIYESGFLPYSGTESLQNIFYMARSLRVPFKQFSLNSENKRILKRFDGQLERMVIPAEAFDTKNKNFIDFCLSYFKKRHGEKIMPRQRLMTILDSPALRDVVVYTKNNNILGYVLLAGDRDVGHYWYSFYDLAYVKQSLGLYLMIDAVRHAAEEGKTYLYLGTAYGEKGLYKSNFNNIEFWDGQEWTRKREMLKQRAKGDRQRATRQTDEWKSVQKNNFF